MPDQNPNPASWADMAASLLSKLSGGVELSCAFDQMELQVPNSQNPAGPPATWRLNGSLRIRTKGEPAPARSGQPVLANPAPSAPSPTSNAPQAAPGAAGPNPTTYGEAAPRG